VPADHVGQKRIQIGSSEKDLRPCLRDILVAIAVILFSQSLKMATILKLPRMGKGSMIAVQSASQRTLSLIEVCYGIKKNLH
jgi:hypothetical protein